MEPAQPEYRPLPFIPILETAIIPMGSLEDMMNIPLPTARDMPSTLTHEKHVLPGPDDNEITVSVFRRKDSEATTRKRLGIYRIHGGGMVMGNRFTNVTRALQADEELDAICVSVEYQLAPADLDPAPVNDCYAELVWASNQENKLWY